MSPSRETYAFIMSGAGLLGFISNLTQMILTFRDKSQYKTAFGIVLLSLNIADLLVSFTCLLVGVIFLLFDYSVFDLHVLLQCRPFMVISITLAFTSSFTHVVFIAVQRIIALVFPLKVKQIITRYRCCVICVLLWVASIGLVVGALFVPPFFLAYMAITTGGLLIIIYTAICYKMTKRNANLENSQGRQRAGGRVFFHSMAVTIVFIICYFPDSLRLLLTDTIDMTEHLSNFVESYLVALNPLLDTLVYFASSYYRSRKRRRRVTPKTRDEPKEEPSKTILDTGYRSSEI